MTRRSLCLLLSCAMSAGVAAGQEPPKVSVSQPLVREVTDYVDLTGRVEAGESVDIRARTGGAIETIAVRAGAAVKKGDVMFKLDDRLLRAELDKATAAVEQAEARLRRTAADLERVKKLASTGAVSKEDLERAEADRADAQAGLRAAQAERELAQVRLSFATVTAPINGKIGRPLVSVGSI